MRKLTLAALAGIAMLIVIPAQAQDVFPVTITTALGDAVIPAKPERVVTWGWSAQDVVLDLGVVPVGMPFFAYGGGDDGVLPWTENAIKAPGIDMPTVLPNAAEPPIEAIAALAPDLILAPYSGLTPDEFAKLSQIAPVVGFPAEPWVISWQDVVELTGKALGLSDKAATLIADTEKMLQQEAAAYSEIKGTSFANVLHRADGLVSVRLEKDPRVKLLVDVGMVAAPPAEGAEILPSRFFYTLSYEKFDAIKADMLVTLFDTQELADSFSNLSYIKLAPLVQKGAIAKIVGIDETMAVSGAVTPMSLRWGFAPYIKSIGEAAKVARQ